MGPNVTAEGDHYTMVPKGHRISPQQRGGPQSVIKRLNPANTKWAAQLTPHLYRRIQGEAVVDAGRQGDQVSLAHGNPDPSVFLISDVKVGLAIQNVADLIVQV